MKRRNFIIGGAITAATGAVLFYDPLVRSIARLASIPEEEIVKGFSHYCEIIRGADFLRLHYYFINLERNGRNLSRINKQQNAYIIVRLPQQHISEEIHNIGNCDPAGLGQPKGYSDSFVSGFSYLSFKLKAVTMSVRYNAETLTNWNNFDLLTMEDLTGVLNLPVKLTLSDNYPLAVDKFPEGFATDQTNDKFIPVTLLEAPYKIILSPIAACLRPERDTDYRYRFVSDNKARLYYEEFASKRSLTLNELWNNDLVFQITSPEETTVLPPHFKVVGYESTKDGELLPAPDDRENLGYLTNLNEPGRDVVSDYFNVSGLGASSFLRYFNLDESNHSLVGWKQQFTLGRDNYIELTEKAIDARSTLKLLVLDIAERRIENGKSLMIGRMYFKYLETSKEFNDPVLFNGHLCKKIVANSQGSFFKDLQDRRHPIDDHFSDSNSFIAYEECPEQLVVLRMPYTITDQAGLEHGIEMDVHIIMKYERHPDPDPDQDKKILNFTQTKVQAALKKFNERLAATASTGEHQIRFNKERVGYAPNFKTEEGVGDQVVNTVLPTNEIQFYSVFNPSNNGADPYEEVFPLLPRLLYASVFLPQLEGIQTVPTPTFVSYSKSYVSAGFSDLGNKAKIFLQTLKETIKSEAITGFERNVADLTDKITEKAGSVKDIFTENYRNAGSLINPDIVIDSVSVLKQGVTMTEDLNTLVDELKQIRPQDVLRGMNTEIFGGIDLKKILKNLLPIQDTPIFNIIEEAADGFAYYEDEYNKRKAQIEQLKAQIPLTEQRLRDFIVDELSEKAKSYIDAYLTAQQRLKQLELTVIHIRDQGGEAINKLIREREKEFADKLTSVIPAELNTFLSESREHIKTIIAVVQIADRIEQRIRQGNIELSFLKKQLEVITNTDADVRKAIDTVTDSFKRNLIVTNFQPPIVGEIIIQLVKGELSKFEGIEIPLPATVATLLQNTVSQMDFELNGLNYKLQDDCNGWIKFLQDKTGEFQNVSAQYYNAFVRAYNEINVLATGFVDREKARINLELNKLQSQVAFNIKNKVEAFWDQVEVLQKFYEFKETYFYLQQLYIHYRNIRDTAQQISEVHNLPDLVTFWKAHDSRLAAVESAIKKELQDQLSKYKFPAEVAAEVENLKTQINAVALQATEEYERAFDVVAGRVVTQIANVYSRIEAERQKIIDEINGYKKELNEKEKEIKNFFKTNLSELENQLKEQNKELIEAYKQGEEEVIKAKEAIKFTTDLLQRLRSITKKEVSYKWSTNQFSETDLGILKFIPGQQPPTELSIDVKSTIRFKLDNLTPSIASVDTDTKSKLTNFALDFLGLIKVDFDNVSFTAGTSVKEKFDVAIKDVRFQGPLNFVEVFQNFLKTIDKGLRFDISAAGASLGYEFSLPDIAGGAFTFAKAKLGMDLRLPFKPGVPMRFMFFLNNPNDMFLVTAGPFGGRGCFQLAVEPKRGVVLIVLIIEFGAVLYLNIGVAQGIVYLFAGIYIRIEYGNVTLAGYLTCGGALDILGLISASVTFYLGLRGSGTYMEGYCTLTYEIKIAAFIKISVGLTMYKRIYGSPSNSSRTDARSNLTETSAAADASDEGNMDIEENTITMTNVEWNDYFEANFHQTKL